MKKNSYQTPLLIGTLLFVVILGAVLLLSNKSTQPKNGTTATTSTVLSGTEVNSQTEVFTLSQVSAHNTEQDCWMVIDGEVYDVTEYIPAHPNREIIDGCGLDATQMFASERKHSGGKAQSLLGRFRIGSIN